LFTEVDFSSPERRIRYYVYRKIGPTLVSHISTEEI